MNKALPALLLLLTACSSTPKQSPAIDKAYGLPAAGTIVATDSVAYAEDPLNHYFFAVTLRVSDGDPPTGSAGQQYDILAGYGPARAKSHMTMPRGTRGLKPSLRRDTAEKYGFIIGFVAGPEYGGDGSFLPYYSVSARRGEISMRQTNDYQFSVR